MFVGWKGIMNAFFYNLTKITNAGQNYCTQSENQVRFIVQRLSSVYECGLKPMSGQLMGMENPSVCCYTYQPMSDWHGF